MVAHGAEQLRLEMALSHTGSNDRDHPLGMLGTYGQATAQPIRATSWTVEPPVVGRQLLYASHSEFELGGVMTECRALRDTGTLGDGRVDYPVVPVSRQGMQGGRRQRLMDRLVLLPSAAYPLAGDG